MGNEVYLGGKPFEAVAKASSQGYTASEGGVHDWTTQGSLKSQTLDAAIFAIVPKRLSQVIEDELGYHIIEVLERQDATVVSFEQAHDEMREAIDRDRNAHRLTTVIAKYQLVGSVSACRGLGGLICCTKALSWRSLFHCC